MSTYRKRRSVSPRPNPSFRSNHNANQVITTKSSNDLYHQDSSNHLVKELQDDIYEINDNLELIPVKPIETQSNFTLDWLNYLTGNFFIILNISVLLSMIIYSFTWNFLGLISWRFYFKMIPAILISIKTSIVWFLNPKKKYPLLITIGTIFCGLGDYLLLPIPLLEQNLLFGIACFSTAHIFYILAMWSTSKTKVNQLFQGLSEADGTEKENGFMLLRFILKITWFSYCSNFIRGAINKGLSEITWISVSIYGMIILYLLYYSVIRSHVKISFWPFLGIFFFTVSDTILAWNLLLSSHWGGDFLSINLYWLALLCLGNSVIN